MTDFDLRLSKFRAAPWASVGIRAGEWERVKRLARVILPDLQPAHRLEFLARSLGYDRAADLQAAIARCSDRDLYLAPDRSAPNRFRMKIAHDIIDGMVREGRDETAIDEAVTHLESVGALFCCGLLSEHQTHTRVTDLAEIEEYQRILIGEGSYIMPGAVYLSDGSFLHISKRSFMTDLRACHVGDRIFVQGAPELSRKLGDPDADFVRISDIIHGGPTRADMARAGFENTSEYIEYPEVFADSIRLTLTAFDGHRDPVAFMGVGFSLSHADPMEFRKLLRASKSRDDAIREFEDMHDWSLRTWCLQVYFTAFEATDREDRSTSFARFRMAIEAVTSAVLEEIHEDIDGHEMDIFVRLSCDMDEFFEEGEMAALNAIMADMVARCQADWGKTCDDGEIIVLDVLD